jgi:sugar O-acyltransferase (sialic acid O-acetyltransferase NeuD family)
MKKIIIVGAGSVGGHIASNLPLYGIEGSLLGFVDDDPAKHGSNFCGFPVLGDVAWLLDKTNLDVVIGIAFPRIKAMIVNKLAVNTHLGFPTLVAKNAWISNGTTLGKGVVIYPGTCINYGSQIHDFVVMNMNCAVGHHCSIGKFSSLAPTVSLGGHTTIGFSVELGIGCSTLQGVNIGSQTIVGAQCMVHQNLPENVLAVGVPAAIKRHLTS